MPSFVALLLTVGFIVFLFARDIRERGNVTGALWLPFFWIVVGPGSRFLSQWLNIFGFNFGAIAVEDGSPIDAAFYCILILTGMFVLNKRRIRISEFIQKNRWLTIFMVYCLVALVWSDYPFVSFKRWIKLLGDPVMALILLTEPEPMEALARTIKRCAYVMLPLSILFIKYFPNLGRLYDTWTGAQMNTGVATNKNELGFDCWIIGSVLVWHLLQVWQWEPGKVKRNELALLGGLLAMDLWLLKLAHSASSLVAFMLCVAIMLFLGFRWVNKQRVSAYMLIGIIFCAVCGVGLGLFGSVIHLLGRNETLTGRTDIWHMLWNWDINPIFGTGFEGFWLGARREAVQNLYPGLNEAHNGYLETYLNLGIVGVLITVAMLLAAYAKAGRAVLYDFEFGRFRLAYLISFVVYNWTEAAFRLNAFPFFMFFLVAMDAPKVRAYVVQMVESPVYEQPEMGFGLNRRTLN
jgi:exopolysaccharide production protein ExoQ